MSGDETRSVIIIPTIRIIAGIWSAIGIGFMVVGAVGCMVSGGDHLRDRSEVDALGDRLGQIDTLIRFLAAFLIGFSMVVIPPICRIAKRIAPSHDR